MSNLVNAFDFSDPDFSIPELPTAPAPHTDSSGNWDGSSYCESLYPVQQPPVPYGSQNSNMSSLSEKGFKSVRGALTEGRYLSFESGSFVLQNGGSNSTGLAVGQATAAHDQRSQLFVVHQSAPGSNQFSISSAIDGSYLTTSLKFTNSSSSAETFTITYLGGGSGYSLETSNNTYITISSSSLSITSIAPSAGFLVFSVTGFV